MKKYLLSVVTAICIGASSFSVSAGAPVQTQRQDVLARYVVERTYYYPGYNNRYYYRAPARVYQYNAAAGYYDRNGYWHSTTWKKGYWHKGNWQRGHWENSRHRNRGGYHHHRGGYHHHGAQHRHHSRGHHGR